MCVFRFVCNTTNISITHFYIMKELLGPAIPTNRQLGETCGSCFCPPTFTAGECAPGLWCKPGPRELSDATGTCVEARVDC